MNYLALLAQFINANYSQEDAQRLAQAAFAKAQANIAAGNANLDKVGSANYVPLNKADYQVPDTELKGIQVNPAGQQAELEAMAKLKELADNGGLSLADMAALNEIQAKTNQNIQANRKGLENQYAARGQLGSGAQLGMQLANQQNAAQLLNTQGEATAGQAQQRALQAIMNRGSLGRTVSQDDYNKQADAAKAADLIKQRNAANSMLVANKNNDIAGQGFDDRLKIAQNKNNLINPGNQLTLDAGQSAANSRLASGALVNGAIGAGAGAASSAWDKFNGPSGNGNGATTPPPMVQAEPDTSIWNEYPDTTPTAATNPDDELEAT